jgi:hypothetical protein
MPVITPQEFQQRHPVDDVDDDLLTDILLYSEQRVRRIVSGAVYDATATDPAAATARLLALSEELFGWAYLLENRNVVLLKTGAAIRLRLPDGVEVQNATPEQINVAVAALELRATKTLDSLIIAETEAATPSIDVRAIDPFDDLTTDDRQIEVFGRDIS